MLSQGHVVSKPAPTKLLPASYPAEVTFPLLPQLIKAGTRFSDPRGMQG